MESELVALEKAGSEAEWLRSLLIDIPLLTLLPLFAYIVIARLP